MIALAACAPSGAADDARPELRLFVAASLTDVVEEIGAGFAARHDVAMSYNFAASGTLARQILAAPRADLFISASEHWMDVVEAAGHVEAGTRRVVSSNRLAVVAHASSSLQLQTPADLCADGFALLALGDPEYVPAGSYAREWLATVACVAGGSAWERLAGRISPAPDARATIAQLEGRRDVVGIVYRTDYLAHRERLRLLYEVPGSSAPRIRYPAAVLREAREPELARGFLEWLAGVEARTILERHGFAAPASKRMAAS